MNGVFRGARFGNSANVLRSNARPSDRYSLSYSSVTVGFRCEWCISRGSSRFVGSSGVF